MAKEKYLLKILSGPHQGAEVALDEGELVIGSSQDCDLILSDTLVSGHHLKVVVTETGVSIVPLESPVYFDGQEIAKDQYFTVEPFKFISIGSTHFVIGPTEGEWPPLSAADIPDLTKLEKEETLEQPVGEEGVMAEGSAAPTPPEGSSDEEMKKLIKGNKKLVFGGLGVIIIIILAIVVMFFGLKGVPELIAPTDVKEKITKVIANTGFPKAFSIEERDGVYFINGWVNTDSERDKVQRELGKIGVPVNVDIKVENQAVDNLEDLLNGLGATYVGVDAIEPGKIRIYGYYGDDLGWESIKSDIEKDVPSLKLLKDDVMTPRKLYGLVGKVLEDDKLVGVVQYVPQKEGIVMKGMISQTNIPKVKESIKHLQAAVGPTIPIKNQIVVAKPEDLDLDLDMDSVIIGKHGFIITKSGQRLFEGGVLKGGYVIQKISRDGIILKKDDQIITLNLGENYD